MLKLLLSYRTAYLEFKIEYLLAFFPFKNILTSKIIYHYLNDSGFERFVFKYFSSEILKNTTSR